ncbi:MAG TPA: methyltransferase [Acidimicrobiia bacterium]|nr:methyltransferase [Acidimicrobiia bacterium]
MSEYLFDNQSEQERRRLDLLQQIFDPITREHLERIALPPDARCLDFGAGAGSVARWLCDRVGPDGRVVATDLDTVFLERLTEKNLDVRRHDILTDDLEEKTFDLIHSRLVLDFFPERRHEVVERLVSALRPGGWLVLEDFDWSTLTAVSPGPRSDVVGRFHGALPAVFPSGAPELGRSLPLTFRAAGLSDVGADGRVHVGLGGTPAARWWQLSVLALRPRIVELGLFSGAEVDEYLQAIDDDGLSFLPVMVTAWGRRPAV